jgi:hypothetical protein
MFFFYILCFPFCFEKRSVPSILFAILPITTLKVLIRLLRHRTARITHRSNGATIDVAIVRQNSVYSKLQVIFSVCRDHRATLLMFGILSYLTLWASYNYPLEVIGYVLLFTGLVLNMIPGMGNHNYALFFTFAATCVMCIWLWSSGWLDLMWSLVESMLSAKEVIHMRMEIQFHENGSATIESTFTRGNNRFFFVGNVSVSATFQFPIG